MKYCFKIEAKTCVLTSRALFSRYHPHSSLVQSGAEAMILNRVAILGRERQWVVEARKYFRQMLVVEVVVCAAEENRQRRFNL